MYQAMQGALTFQQEGERLTDEGGGALVFRLALSGLLDQFNIGGRAADCLVVEQLALPGGQTHDELLADTVGGDLQGTQRGVSVRSTCS